MRLARALVASMNSVNYISQIQKKSVQLAVMNTQAASRTHKLLALGAGDRN